MVERQHYTIFITLYGVATHHRIASRCLAELQLGRAYSIHARLFESRAVSRLERQTSCLVTRALYLFLSGGCRHLVALRFVAQALFI